MSQLSVLIPAEGIQKKKIKLPFVLRYILLGWILTSWIMFCYQFLAQLEIWCRKYLLCSRAHWQLWAKLQGWTLSDINSSITYPAY